MIKGDWNAAPGCASRDLVVIKLSWHADLACTCDLLLRVLEFAWLPHEWCNNVTFDVATILYYIERNLVRERFKVVLFFTCLTSGVDQMFFMIITKARYVTIFNAICFLEPCKLHTCSKLLHTANRNFYHLQHQLRQERSPFVCSTWYQNDRENLFLPCANVMLLNCETQPPLNAVLHRYLPILPLQGIIRNP